jgi:hypothetical protein
MREFCNKGITNRNGVLSGIARHNMKLKLGGGQAYDRSSA